MPSTKPKNRDLVIRDMRAGHSKDARARVASKGKRIESLMSFFRKKYKSETFTTVASGSRAANLSVVPSGWQEIDDLITGETDKEARTIPGSGLGWPRGRIIEIYGKEGVGKTTLALQIIAACQKAGEVCAFVDAEHALDTAYAAKLGVNMSELLLNQPDAGGERALDVTTKLCSSGVVGCVVVDSVAALTPLAELNLDLEKNARVGEHARMMSRSLRKLTAIVARNNVLLVFLNQTRMKIGVMFGNPETTTGGGALKFYASVRIELTNVKTVKKGDRVTHRRTRIKVQKNKVAPPFREVFADIVPNRGFTSIYGDPGFDDD